MIPMIMADIFLPKKFSVLNTEERGMIIHERANGIIVESMRGEKAPRQAAEILAKSKFDYMLHAEIQKLKKEEDKK